jgi:hypothetical protein
MKPTLGAFTYVYNMVAYDYPFVESVQSVIDVVDEFVICECNSTDETMKIVEVLRSLYPEKIKVVHRNWVQHFTDIQNVANFASSHLTTDYMFQLQADEVVHEDSLPALLATVAELHAIGARKSAARVHYTHFMANYETTFPFCYETLVRIVRRGSPWKIIGDGVQFAFNDQYVPNVYVLDGPPIEVFHYGKVKDPVKGWQKEWDFQQLYVDIGFPDPKMQEMLQVLGHPEVDYVYLFADHVKNGTIKKFEGTHPAVMHARITAFKDGGFEQFVSRVKADLAIRHGEPL